MGLKEQVMHSMMKLCGFGSCEQVSRDCYDYAEGTLNNSATRRTKRHLRICKQCLRFMTSYLAIKTFGITSTIEKLSVEQKEQLFKKLLE